jgi:arylsulfatase
MGNAAVRNGKWKLVRTKGKPWELYDLEADRSELNDLANSNPDRVEALRTEWKIWAERVGAAG